MPYPFHLYFGRGGVWFHASDFCNQVSPYKWELQCCSRWSAECLRNCNKKYKISLKRNCCLQHWQGLGKSIWRSDFTWNLTFLLTGLVNNVLRKRLKMRVLFPDSSLVFWLTLAIFSWAYFFVISLPLKHEWRWSIHYLAMPVY